MRKLKPCKHCGSKNMWHEKGCIVVLEGKGFDADSFSTLDSTPKPVEWWDVVVNPKRYTKHKLY
jgi:hypothetical protein